MLEVSVRRVTGFSLYGVVDNVDYVDGVDRKEAS
jgi:hypothetical protein